MPSRRGVNGRFKPDETQEKLALALSELERVQANSDQWLARCTTLSNSFDRVENENKKLLDQVGGLRDGLRAKDGEITSLKKELRNAAGTDDRVSDLTERLNEAIRHNKDWQTSHADLGYLNEGLKTVIKEHENRNKNLSESYRDTVDSYKTLQSRARIDARKVEALTKKLKELRAIVAATNKSQKKGEILTFRLPPLPKKHDRKRLA